MMFFRRWVALIAICFAVQSSAAQYAGSFSRVGFGARGISLGNGLAGDARSGTTPYYNPAFAPLGVGQNIVASVASLSFDRSLQFLQLSAPLQKKAGFALGLIHASVSNIDGRDKSGFHTANLSVDEYAGFLAFGLKFSLCLLGDLDGFDFFLLGVLTADSSLPIIPFTSLLTVLMEVPALLDFSCCCGLFTNYYCFRATLLCVLLRSLDALDIELAPLLIGERRA